MGEGRSSHSTPHPRATPRGSTPMSAPRQSASQHTLANTYLVGGLGAMRRWPVMSVLLCVLLCGAGVADAFFVRWDGPDAHDLQQYDESAIYRDPSYNESDAAEEFAAEEPDHVDQYVNVLKRWGHASRFPWKKLRRGICFRQPCKRDRDCCQNYNICDRSARVCIDCWYGSICKSERDCCKKFPYCQRIWKETHGKRYIQSGKCVDKL